MLTILQCCQSEQSDDQLEADFRVEWTEPPRIGDLVSMERSPRWEVVQVTPYSNGSSNVYLVHVNRADLPVPPINEWDAYFSESLMPGNSINLWFAGAQQPIYQTFHDRAPNEGEFKQWFSATEEPRLSDWAAKQVQTFQPASDNPPYAAINLCWCVARELAIAS